MFQFPLCSTPSHFTTLLYFRFTRLPKVGNAPSDIRLTLVFLTGKFILYTGILNTYSLGPNFHLFCSTTRRFRDKRLSIILNAPNDISLNLNTLTVKSTRYALNSCPRGLNFGIFAQQDIAK